MPISFQRVVIKPVMDGARALARCTFDDDTRMHPDAIAAVKLVPDKTPSPMIIEPTRVDRLVQVLALRDTDASEIDAVVKVSGVGNTMWAVQDDMLRVIYQDSPDRGRPNAMASALIHRPVYGPAIVLKHTDAKKVEDMLFDHAEAARVYWETEAEAQRRGCPG